MRLPDTVAFEIFGRISAVRACLDEMRKSLPEIAAHQLETLDRLAQEQDWDANSYLSSRGDIEIKFARWIPTVLGYSLVILIHSIVETGLLGTARRVRELRSIALAVGEIAGDPVDRAQTYLTKVAGVAVGSDPAWQELGDLGKLRHLLVHRHGLVGTNEFEHKHIKTLVDRYSPDVGLSGPLGNPFTELTISLELCGRFLSTAEAFFERLLPQCGLRVSPG